MISIIITAFKEPRTIARSIESIIHQEIKEDYELIVFAPDEETLNIVKSYSKNNKKINFYKDPGKGKSYAINLFLNKLKGKIIILTDGDVYVSKNSINNILKEFDDPSIGCVSGRPVPQESKNTKFGFWAHFLMDSAHLLRRRLKENKDFLECSGYLWAFRNHVINSFPTDVAEDTIVPSLFFLKNYRMSYAENALVYVKNANNLKDWIKQKTRTHKSHGKIENYVKGVPKVKTFKTELTGIYRLLCYPRNPTEFLWIIELAFFRLYTWMKFFYDSRLIKKTYQDGWDRVESTK